MKNILSVLTELTDLTVLTGQKDTHEFFLSVLTELTALTVLTGPKRNKLKRENYSKCFDCVNRLTVPKRQM